MIGPTPQETLARIMDAMRAEIRTAFPGTVVSYDRGTQTARIRPGVKAAVPTFDDPEVDAYETLPDLPMVPVCWPRGGGSFLALDLEPGDPVLVVCGDTDYSGWWRSGSAGKPEDGRLHDPTHAFCIPGPPNKRKALTGLTGPMLQLGNGSDAAALASQLDRLITTIKNWAPVVSDGGAALKAAIVAAFPAVGGSAAPTPATTTGSAQVKVSG